MKEAEQMSKAEQTAAPAPEQVQAKEREQKLEIFDRELLAFQILACAAVMD